MDVRPFAFTSSVPVHSPFKENEDGFRWAIRSRYRNCSMPKTSCFSCRIMRASGFASRPRRLTACRTRLCAWAIFRRFCRIPGSSIRRTGTLMAISCLFAGNIIPLSELSPTSLALLPYYPLPNIPGAGRVNIHLQLDKERSPIGFHYWRIDYTESHFIQCFHNLNNPIPGTGATASRTNPGRPLGARPYVDTCESPITSHSRQNSWRRLTSGLSVAATTYTPRKSMDDRLRYPWPIPPITASPTSESRAT